MNSEVIIYDTVEFSNSARNIFIIPNVVFQPSFSFSTLLTSLNFDRKFKSGRLTQLFGSNPYKYSSVLHNPTNMQDNFFVHEMFEFVNNNFPSFKLNSCLINYYPSIRSSMPDHSDNEPSIAQDSFIVTISLGTKRRMFFKDVKSAQLLCSIMLDNGHVLIFSKNSQCCFTHGIPTSMSAKLDDYTPRLSATFRRII